MAYRRYVKRTTRRVRRGRRVGRRVLGKRGRGLSKRSSRPSTRRRMMDIVPGVGSLPYRIGFPSQEAGTSIAGAMRKRARSGFGSNDPDSGTGAYNQWSQRYAQAKLGRMTLRKIINNTLDSTIFTWQRLGRFGDKGQIFIGQYDDATNLRRYLPTFVFDLTSCNNWTNGGRVDYAPMWRMYKNAGAGVLNGQIGWELVQGQSSGGASNLYWQVEKSAHNTASQLVYPNDNSILKWASLEWELWGMQNHPTKYTIELIQFNEDVCPQLGVLTGNTGGHTNDWNYNEFWDSMTKSYTYNPLMTMQNGWGKKKFKILRRYNVDIDPTASFENDADPHVKTFKMFFRLNRKCTYNWKNANAVAQTVAEFDDSDFKQVDQENQQTVHPNARVFMMIRASDYNVKANAAAQTSASTPSFSAKIRTCHVINS